MKLSVGIGLTNDCNLRCAHCYRDTHQVSYLSLEQVKVICENIPVSGMGFGTGESALNPEFGLIIDYLQERGIKLSLASNGYSLMALSDEQLRAFHDAEVSIDFPSQKDQDAFRGEGNWALVHQAMDRCRKLGVPISILVTMMNINYSRMDTLVEMGRVLGATLRINAYQAVKTDRFKLSYEQFWEGYCRLFGAAKVVSCTEPVVRAAMGLSDVLSPCGHGSIRFNQRGQVIPCVYWPLADDVPTIAQLPQLGRSVMETGEFRRARAVPTLAADCRCRGGCASRRALSGNLDAHDEYCPWARGDEIRLDWQPANAVDLMRAGNVCTTIVAR